MDVKKGKKNKISKLFDENIYDIDERSLKDKDEINSESDSSSYSSEVDHVGDIRENKVRRCSGWSLPGKGNSLKGQKTMATLSSVKRHSLFSTGSNLRKNESQKDEL